MPNAAHLRGGGCGGGSPTRPMLPRLSTAKGSKPLISENQVLLLTCHPGTRRIFRPTDRSVSTWAAEFWGYFPQDLGDLVVPQDDDIKLMMPLS